MQVKDANTTTENNNSKISNSSLAPSYAAISENKSNSLPQSPYATILQDETSKEERFKFFSASEAPPTTSDADWKANIKSVEGIIDPEKGWGSDFDLRGKLEMFTDVFTVGNMNIYNISSSPEEALNNAKIAIEQLANDIIDEYSRVEKEKERIKEERRRQAEAAAAAAKKSGGATRNSQQSYSKY